MTFIDLAKLEAKHLLPDSSVKFVHTENMTFAYWTLKAGFNLPEHSHPHEQVSNVLEGRLSLTIEGETQTLVPGKIAVIPSNAIHGGTAITDCRVLDVFHPVREDYKQASD